MPSEPELFAMMAKHPDIAIKEEHLS